MIDSTTRPVRLDDGEELDAFVARHDVALVEFYTKGCAKCQAMEPVLGNVARVTDAAIGLLNPGNDIGLVERFDIASVPTLVLFRDGAVVARTAEGFQGTEAVRSFVERHAPDAVGDA